MAIPIILYPAALISSFSGLLVPELAECRVQGYHKRIDYMISRVWSFALWFSIGIAGILICFSGEIGDALYPATDTGRYIRILAPLIPIMYLDTATDAMLKGLGEQVFSMNVNILDALLSVVLVWLLIPRYGIMGYLITVYFSEIFNTVLSIHRLLSISTAKVRLLKWVYQPLFCIVGATSITHILLKLANDSQKSSALSILLHCTWTLALYIALLLLTKGIDKEDLAWLKTLFQRSPEGAPPSTDGCRWAESASEK